MCLIVSPCFLRKELKVVVINTAHGLKFTEHKVKFHSGELTPRGENSLENSPIEVSCDVEAVVSPSIGSWKLKH